MNLATPSFANLAGSGFDAGDANLVLNDDGQGGNEDVLDWENAPNFGKTLDLLKGQGDNAIGQGSSEDDPVPTLVSDGIPPNKSDITRFYVGSNTVAGPPLRNFLYLAWERITDPTGTTNFDFELNQSTALSSNGATPVRLPGDVLIKYDLANGGTHPVLGFHRWITSGVSANADCEANSKFPCWDKVHPITGANFEAAINDESSVVDPIAPDAPRTLVQRTFGEAAIDLVGAGILQAGSCEGFASAYLKSRSSDAFNSAIKDFASPVPTLISNCGALRVQKYIDIDEDGAQDANETTVPPVVSGDLGGWSITVTGPNNFSCTGTTNASGLLTNCLKGDGTAADLTELAPGSYTVTENANATKTVGNGAAFYNTDPGPKPAAAPVSQIGIVNIGTTTTVDLGNSCFNSAVFEVTNVPAEQTSLFVRYWTTDPAVTTDVNMAKVGTTSTYRATAGGFVKGAIVSWQFGLTSDRTVRVAGPAITAPGYQSCQATAARQFPTATIAGVKYLDRDVDGTRDTGEGPLAGFTIQLKKNGNVVASTKTANDGTFSFTGVDAATTYVLQEVATTGWIQTEPSSNGTITVNVPLDATTVSTYGNPAVAIRFGNSPLSKIDVTFTSLGQLRDADGNNIGAATRATSIQCTSGVQTPTVVGGSTNSNTATADNLNLTRSPVSCVVTYETP